MTEIERKALALVNEVKSNGLLQTYHDAFTALCRAIEQHEAFRREVSDAVEVFMPGTKHQEAYLNYAQHFARFIIAKPDPLVEVLADMGLKPKGGYDWASEFRAAIEARGLEIVEKRDD